MAKKVATRKKSKSKKKASKSRAKSSTGKKRVSKKKTSRKKSRTAGAATAPSANELLNRAEQLGAILAKGIDLAEAGLSLGLTLMQRVGSVAQESISDRVPGEADQASPTGRGPVSEAPAGDYATAPSPDQQGAAPVHGYFIVNRLPLQPGSAAAVSFSINNDALSMPKRVELRVGDFVGEKGGVRIAENGFSVKPTKKIIAPMDFEKFVLRGEIPQDTLPDVYRGSVTVLSEEEFEIPVRLVVTPPSE